MIVMRATDNVGTPEATGPGVDYSGQKGQAPGAVKDDMRTPTVEQMSYFQNHATHEVGHAVGQRALKRGGYADKGDDIIKKWADWKDGGDATAFVRMLGFTAAFDKKTFSVRHNGTSYSYSGDEVREFVEGCLDEGPDAMSSHKIAKQLGGGKPALAALKLNPDLAGTPLLSTMIFLKDVLPGAAWAFPDGINGAARVTMKNNNKWQNYDAAVWNTKVSTYATSAPAELFAEIYTAKFVSQQNNLPSMHGVDIENFLNTLAQASPQELGLPAPATKSPGAEAAAVPGSEPHEAMPAQSPRRPWP